MHTSTWYLFDLVRDHENPVVRTVGKRKWSECCIYIWFLRGRDLDFDKMNKFGNGTGIENNAVMNYIKDWNDEKKYFLTEMESMKYR